MQKQSSNSSMFHDITYPNKLTSDQ